MAHRSKDRQEVHDKKVAEIAKNLEKKGYDVQADLPGHKKPKRIGKHIPDMIATKGDKVLVREIETPATVSKDKDQHKAFKKLGRYKQCRISYLNREKEIISDLRQQMIVVA